VVGLLDALGRSVGNLLGLDDGSALGCPETMGMRVWVLGALVGLRVGVDKIEGLGVLALLLLLGL